MNKNVPVMLHINRRFGGVSCVGSEGLLRLALLPPICGTGIVRVMGLWNFLLLGSTVMMGLTVTLLPNRRVTKSWGTG